jgi:hypothetical protein
MGSGRTVLVHHQIRGGTPGAAAGRAPTIANALPDFSAGHRLAVDANHRVLLALSARDGCDRHLPMANWQSFVALTGGGACRLCRPQDEHVNTRGNVSTDTNPRCLQLSFDSRSESEPWSPHYRHQDRRCPHRVERPPVFGPRWYSQTVFRGPTADSLSLKEFLVRRCQKVVNGRQFHALRPVSELPSPLGFAIVVERSRRQRELNGNRERRYERRSGYEPSPSTPRRCSQSILGPALLPETLRTDHPAALPTGEGRILGSAAVPMSAPAVVGSAPRTAGVACVHHPARTPRPSVSWPRILGARD